MTDVRITTSDNAQEAVEKALSPVREGMPTTVNVGSSKIKAAAIKKAARTEGCAVAAATIKDGARTEVGERLLLSPDGIRWPVAAFWGPLSAPDESEVPWAPPPDADELLGLEPIDPQAQLEREAAGRAAVAAFRAAVAEQRAEARSVAAVEPPGP